MAVTQCPKSYIRGESLALLEKFYLFRQFPTALNEELSAKEVDAFLLLESELRREVQDEAK